MYEEVSEGLNEQGTLKKSRHQTNKELNEKGSLKNGAPNSTDSKEL